MTEMRWDNLREACGGVRVVDPVNNKDVVVGGESGAAAVFGEWFAAGECVRSPEYLREAISPRERMLD